MRTIRQSDYERVLASDPYYAGRWPYMAAACGMIAGLEDFAAVLELGAYKLPLVPECDTMDIRQDLQPTFVHDARRTPWPIRDGAYDLFIALQVWEHLDGRQVEAFREVKRIARSAIISVPWQWPDRFGAHAKIGESVLSAWTDGTPGRFDCLIEGPLPRMICYWPDLPSESESACGFTNSRRAGSIAKPQADSNTEGANP
ncbi:MAG TPA: hypothetical protein VMW52_12560 [Phycisphaerae bacterium]|nr:hypothetical protein [Phycisphaerae bacterium]